MLPIKGAKHQTEMQLIGAPVPATIEPVAASRD
jgi:hypothetical protein